MTLPDFLYIGTGKAGSTWLFETLARHPGVHLTDVKETNFFDLNYQRGLGWYGAFFDGAAPQQKVGEIAHRYLRHPEAALRVRSDLGAVKLMIGLREPLGYFVSDYLFTRRNGQTGLTVSDYADKQFDWPALDWPQMIAPWLDIFGRDAFTILDFAVLQRDPQAYLDQVADFLELVPMSLDDEGKKEINKARSARNKTLARLVNNSAKWIKRRGGQRLVQMVKGNARVQQALFRDLDEKPVVDEALQERLRAKGVANAAWVDAAFGTALQKSWYGSEK